MKTSPPLSNLLANRRWLYRSRPFPHVVARNVFTPSFYGELETAFNEVLARGLGERRIANQLSRSMHGYDAYGMTFPQSQSYPFSVLISRPWHDLLAGIFGINATGDINCGLHHHAVGSASGWVHNDLNPGWFPEDHGHHGITVVQHELCGYTNGKAYRRGVRPRESVRALAMLFYLNNPPWSPGDGGGTGLYRSKDDPVSRPVLMVPPVNNSLLLFECTPYSFHSFIHNRRHPRNSIIMWLHRSKEDTIARWGAEKIVPWPKL